MDPSNGDPPRSWIDAAVELLGRAGTLGTVKVQGNSMAPTLSPGTLLLVEFRTDRLRAGEILLFRQGGVLVVHRLLARVRSRRAGPCLRMRGDGRPLLDPPVFDRDVVGRVVAIRRDRHWRTLRGSVPRFYARLLAWHDHTWSGLAWLGGGLDRWSPVAFARKTAIRLDRWTLRLADAVLFRLVHRPVAAPDEATAAMPARPEA